MDLRGFEPVSRCLDAFTAEGSTGKLPQRSTKNSAGYDFYAFEDITIPSHLKHLMKIVENISDEEKWITPFAKVENEWIIPYCIKTGVKAYMQDDEVLQLYIRSSAPSKLGLVMANSVGIIDSDYYDNPDNEGEIGFLVYNLTASPVTIHKGEKIGQAVFTKFLKADNDNVTKERVGGYGSTGA